MVKKLFVIGLGLFSLAYFTPAARAQFADQMNYLGPHVGLSGVGSALTLGLDYERGITTVGQVGPGIIGVGGLFDYFSYGDNPGGYGGTWTYIDIGVTGMYHFVLTDRKWDPFLGIYLGDEISSWSWGSSAKAYYASIGVPAPSETSGGITVGGCAGVRYFFNNAWAAEARLGFGFYVLALGVDYSF